MKAERAFTLIGKKLEKEYKKTGFKYSKKYMFLKRTTKRYVYYIFFSQFFEYIPDTYIELHVILVIHDRILLKINKNANSEVFYIDLWKKENHYNIANKTLIDNVFMDLKNKVETYLIPQIKKLEEETP
jgi:hypothetical protein